MYQVSPHSQRVGFVEGRPQAGRICKHNYCLLGTENELEKKKGQSARLRNDGLYKRLRFVARELAILKR